MNLHHLIRASLTVNASFFATGIVRGLCAEPKFSTIGAASVMVMFLLSIAGLFAELARQGDGSGA